MQNNKDTLYGIKFAVEVERQPFFRQIYSEQE